MIYSPNAEKVGTLDQTQTKTEHNEFQISEASILLTWKTSNVDSDSFYALMKHIRSS